MPSTHGSRGLQGSAAQTRARSSPLRLLARDPAISRRSVLPIKPNSDPQCPKRSTGLQATVVNQLPGGLAGPIVAGNAAWTTNRHSQQDLQRKLWSSNSAWRLQSNTSREGEQHQIRTETGKGWYWRFRKASELLRHVCGRLDPSRTKATFSPRPHLKPWAHTIPYQNHLQTGRL